MRSWLLFPLLAACVSSCTYGVDPDGDSKFSCATTADCGEDFECRLQANREGGLCHPAGECADDEIGCDGLDEDCNGVIDDVSWSEEPCPSMALGVCAPGHRVCASGAEACVSIASAALELCNALDDDCDGAIDEDFDLSADEANCGACGSACATGSECAFSSCVERDCADATDNDTDGLTDCADGDCVGRSCLAASPDYVCGLLPLPTQDGGESDGGEAMDAGEADAGEPFDAGEPMDAGELDAGEEFDGGEPVDAGEPDAGEPFEEGPLVPQCVPSESACGNGADDDGDALVDCADPHCDLEPCGDGGTCSAQMCQ